MPKDTTRGRDRLDYKGSAAMIDALKEEAEDAGLAFSAYLTVKFTEILRRAGRKGPGWEKKKG